MNTSNVELLVQTFAGWGRDNPANMRDILDPDCELVVPDSDPVWGHLSGSRRRDRLVHSRVVAMV
jgi:ketosteroid isomerase-like protein